MAFLKVADELIAAFSQVGKNAYPYITAFHDKAAGIGSVMKLWKCGNRNGANLNGLMHFERKYGLTAQQQPATAFGSWRDVNRQIVFFAQSGYPTDMIGVLMGYKDGLNFFYGQAELMHSVFNFAAGETYIYQYCFLVISQVIAVSVTSRI